MTKNGIVLSPFCVAVVAVVYGWVFVFISPMQNTCTAFAIIRLQQRNHYKTRSLLPMGTDESMVTALTERNYDEKRGQPMKNGTAPISKEGPITAQQHQQNEQDQEPINDATKRSTTTTTNKNTSISENIFELLAYQSLQCLLLSDIRRDAIGKNVGSQASSATNWIDEISAQRLQQTVDQVQIKETPSNQNKKHGGSSSIHNNLDELLDADVILSYMRWMKAIPTCTILDLSNEFRSIAKNNYWTMMQSIHSSSTHGNSEQQQNDFMARMGFRIILLPSGVSMIQSLQEPTASIILGKLLYGGVARYRFTTSPATTSSISSNTPRKTAGHRTVVKSSSKDNVPSWMMYGGCDRMYTAIDMGSAAVLEIYLLPHGKKLEAPCTEDNVTAWKNNNMLVQGITWKPQHMLDSYKNHPIYNDEDSDTFNTPSDKQSTTIYTSSSSLSGKDRNDAFRSDFQSVVGGLQPQIDAIVRRVLDGRVIRPDDNDIAKDKMDMIDQQCWSTSLEAKELELLGLTPVRGLLLYGPPGCGKTILAREIARALKARTPKIVAAPELLDRWVGGSEKLVRLLFADAEAELAACNGDATKSALHVIVIDEIDAVFRKRSSAEESGEATRSSVVNQILSKLDGVQAIPNILLIGMTNRRELLDEALLRPGRLEVQMEIPLPDRNGRREILQIHFGALRQKGRLSIPLCCAMDGVPIVHMNSKIHEIRPGNKAKQHFLWKNIRRILPSSLSPVYDLASDSVTGGFSGAELSGLVRCAGSIALARSRQDGNGVDGLLITLEDVKQALTEVKR